MRRILLALCIPTLLAGCCSRSRCCPPLCGVALSPPATAAPAVVAASPQVADARPAGRQPAPPGPGAPAPDSMLTAPNAPKTLASAPTSPRLKAGAPTTTGTSKSFSGYAQVSLQNSTSVTLDLYVNGAYGCRALRNLLCTTQVRPGELVLEARGPNGESATASTAIEAGDSITWTVAEEE